MIPAAPGHSERDPGFAASHASPAPVLNHRSNASGDVSGPACSPDGSRRGPSPRYKCRGPAAAAGGDMRGFGALLLAVLGLGELCAPLAALVLDFNGIKSAADAQGARKVGIG